jgi:transposase-like protein
LDDGEWLVLIVDGKTFATDQIMVALGVTSTGEKRILGLVQTATENRRTIGAFLRELTERGFAATGRLLVVIDGSKGLRRAIADVFGDRAEVQRCQWHKRENVVSYLPNADQAAWRRKLQAAYAHPAYADAKRALTRLHRELAIENESAAASLLEGIEETLTLHRLNVFPELGRAFKTTNAIESVMARVEHKTSRVTHWRTSDQKLRWCAAGLLATEATFRRVKGCDKLPLLKQALTSNRSTNTHAAA